MVIYTLYDKLNTKLPVILTFNAILGMIIDSFMNMFKALLWFSYWPNVFDMEYITIWFIAAYIGYRFGANLAQRYVVHREEHIQDKYVEETD